jgi:hypothetical protein
MRRRVRPLLVFAALAGAPSAVGQTPPAAPTPADKLKAIAADLKEARELLRKVSDRAARDRLELLISRSELAAGEVQRALAATATPAAMSAERFAAVLKGLKGESFDDGKVRLVKGLGGSARFTSAQAKELLAAFAFDAGRKEAALHLYPLVTDPEFFFQALDAFTFESGRNEVREKLKLK